MGRASGIELQLTHLTLFALLASLSGCTSAPKMPSNQAFLDGMVLVPAGEFCMGQDAGASDADETPQHTVSLGDFYIDRTEVTNAQFATFCAATDRIFANAPYWDESYASANPENPVADYNWVFIPYCTADVHTGSRDQTYTDVLGLQETLRHQGYVNAHVWTIVRTFAKIR